MNQAGVDTRSVKMAGKLVIDLGLGDSGKGIYLSNLGKRGFHSMGVQQMKACAQTPSALAYDGDCRLNNLDGKPHGTQSSVQTADSIMTQVLENLKSLRTLYPAEDWGYFLNQDESVRWSDVAWTGWSS